MKRRILTCLLVLCMILALVPMMAVATGAEDDGIVATVTANGKTVLQATTLSDAFAAAAKRSGATVVLMDDVTVTAGFDFAGTYTFDLNGHTISAHTPLLQTRGTVTIIDSSEGQTGVIRGEGCPALRLAGVTYTLEDEEGNVTTNYDGNIVLKSGTFDATDCDYGVYNSGKGVLYLTGTPKLAKGIYLAYSDSLCGTDKPVANAEQAPALYEGDVVSVYYAEDPIPENALLLQNGDTSKFDFAQRGYYTAQAIDGTYVFSKWGYLSFAFSALIAFIILVIVLALVIKVARTKKKIAKMQIFSIPAFLPFMAAMGDMWRLVLVALVALLLITIVLSIVIRSSMKKKLKAATKAYKARLKKEAANAAVAAAAEAVVEEAPVEEAPAEEAPAEEVAVEETPVEEAPAEEAPVEEAPAEEAPVEEAPAEEAPAEEAPVEEAPAEEAPAEEAPVEEVVVEEAPVEEAPVEEAPAEEVAVEEAPAEEVAVEETPVEEAPAEEVAVEETPVEEAPAEEVAVEETPVEEAPAEEVAVEETPVEEAPAKAKKQKADKYANIPQYDKKAAKKAAKEAKKAAKEAKKANKAEQAPECKPEKVLTDAQRDALEAAAKKAAKEEIVAEPAEIAVDLPVEEIEEAPALEVVEEPAAPQRLPNVLVNAPVFDADGKATSYTNYKKSFMARIVLSSDEVQERYNVMKNALLSYKKVNARISWSYESIKSARTQLAKFAIRGKTLCMYLALDPRSLTDSKYNISDESESKKYDTVPCCLRLTSKRSIKWGLELIEKMAAELGLETNPKYAQVNYIPDAKSDEELLELGLIKKVE